MHIFQQPPVERLFSDVNDSTDFDRKWPHSAPCPFKNIENNVNKLFAELGQAKNLLKQAEDLNEYDSCIWIFVRIHAKKASEICVELSSHFVLGFVVWRLTWNE